MSTVEAQRIGDRIREIRGIIDGISSGAGGLKKVIEFLGSIDFSKLSQVIAAFKAIADAPDLKSQVILTIEALKIAVSMTATEVDDTLVATLDKIVGDGSLIDLISGWIGNQEAQAAGGVVAMSDEGLDSAEVHAAAIDIPTWIALAKLIFSIVKQLRS